MKCKYCEKEHRDNNTGCNNSGHRNSGHRNSGDYNSGDYNSGHRNSGHRNSGHRNSGDRNSGDYNSGDYNSGWFNTNEPTIRFFNKESNIKYSEFDVRYYPDLKVCAWVDEEDLPEDEKTTETAQMGGKLKTLTYREAWKEYWDRACDEAKEWFQSLPNFDAKIFKEITGIDVIEKEEMIEIDGKKWSVSTIKEALRNHLDK